MTQDPSALTREELLSQLATLDRQLRWRRGKYSMKAVSGLLCEVVAVVCLLALIVFGISLHDVVVAPASDPPAGGSTLPVVAGLIAVVTAYPAVRLYLHALSNVPLKERPVLGARREALRTELAGRPDR